jgi:GNAT superfamily N-acetyltransferase
MQTRFFVQLEVTIRGCSRRDLPLLEWFGLYRDHRRLIEDAFRRHEAGEVIMLVADLDGFPVGQGWVDVSERKVDSVGVIWALRVFPLLRNHGIGTRLMTVAEQLLTDAGFRWTELTVDQQEPRARRLYERLGYRLHGSTQAVLRYTTPDNKSVAQRLHLWILRKPLRQAQDSEMSERHRGNG